MTLPELLLACCCGDGAPIGRSQGHGTQTEGYRVAHCDSPQVPKALEIKLNWHKIYNLIVSFKTVSDMTMATLGAISGVNILPF